MKTPNIQNYFDYPTFLKDLYETNRQKSGVGSFRFYAQKLKWPVSYLNEVIAGKKKLTLNRALELGMFLKLDGVDIERLIFLTLKDSDHGRIKNYFASKIMKEGHTEGHFDITQKKKSKAPQVRVIDEDIFSDISLLAIADLIVMHQGKIAPSGIMRSLATFPELKDPKVLLSKIEILERHQIIQRKTARKTIIGFDYKTERLAFSIDRNTVKHMAQYADNYKRMILGPSPKGWITSGFIKISKYRLSEAKKRILSFRNWLLELEDEVLSDPRYRSEDVLLFQMDANLLAIVDCAERGIKNLEDWMIEK